MRQDLGMVWAYWAHKFNLAMAFEKGHSLLLDWMEID